VLVVVDVEVLVLELLVLVELLVVVGMQAPQTLPVPPGTPPAAAQRAPSREIRGRDRQSSPSHGAPAGGQQTTAADRPQVDRAAQRRMARASSERQPARRSALRARATQLTYRPWLVAPSHGQSASSAAATSSGHGTSAGRPCRPSRPASTLAGSARRTNRTRHRAVRIVFPPGRSVPDAVVRAPCQPNRRVRVRTAA
jgi:hypothetical protein